VLVSIAIIDVWAHSISQRPPHECPIPSLQILFGEIGAGTLGGIVKEKSGALVGPNVKPGLRARSNVAGLVITGTVGVLLRVLVGPYLKQNPMARNTKAIPNFPQARPAVKSIPCRWRWAVSSSGPPAPTTRLGCPTPVSFLVQVAEVAMF